MLFSGKYLICCLVNYSTNILWLDWIQWGQASRFAGISRFQRRNTLLWNERDAFLLWRQEMRRQSILLHWQRRPTIQGPVQVRSGTRRSSRPPESSSFLHRIPSFSLGMCTQSPQYQWKPRPVGRLRGGKLAPQAAPLSNANRSVEFLPESEKVPKRGRESKATVFKRIRTEAIWHFPPISPTSNGLVR